MKIVVFWLIFGTASVFVKLEPGRIVPEFYRLLARSEEPSEQEESDFFGGEECSGIRTLILSSVKYSGSKTPIWKYVRDHKEFFVTAGLDDVSTARVMFSDPVRMTRIWNLVTDEEFVVYATFPTRMSGHGRESLGVSMARFTLGRSCYLNIGGTFVSGPSVLFFGYVHSDVRQPAGGAEIGK